MFLMILKCCLMILKCFVYDFEKLFNDFGMCYDLSSSSQFYEFWERPVPLGWFFSDPKLFRLVLKSLKKAI